MGSSHKNQSSKRVYRLLSRRYQQAVGRQRESANTQAYLPGSLDMWPNVKPVPQAEVPGQTIRPPLQKDRGCDSLHCPCSALGWQPARNYLYYSLRDPGAQAPRLFSARPSRDQGVGVPWPAAVETTAQHACKSSPLGGPGALETVPTLQGLQTG